MRSALYPGSTRSSNPRTRASRRHGRTSSSASTASGAAWPHPSAPADR